MVIYDLKCELSHEFEGWFKNSDDMLSQKEDGLLTCPYCDSSQIFKKVTAAKIGRKSNTLRPTVSQPKDSLVNESGDVTSQKNSVTSQKPVVTGDSSAQKFRELQGMLAKVHDYIDTNFQDVGNRFAEEAISMHRGEKEVGSIKGTVSVKQMEQLEEEGVQAVPLPPKPIDKKKLN